MNNVLNKKIIILMEQIYFLTCNKYAHRYSADMIGFIICFLNFNIISVRVSKTKLISISTSSKISVYVQILLYKPTNKTNRLKLFIVYKA